MLTIQKLEYMENLTANEKRVAMYLSQHQRDIRRLSITDISSLTFTSPSTTVRLAKKLGYPGWKELKLAIEDEIQYIHAKDSDVDVNIPFTSGNSPYNIANNIAKIQSDAMYDTLRLLDFDTLQKVAYRMYQAREIYIYGFSNAVISAYDFALKMRTIHRRVTVLDNSEQFPFFYTQKNSDICHVFVSYSGETRELFRAMDTLHKNNIPLIAITSIGQNTLERKSDLTLHISTKEKLYSKITTYASGMAFHFVFDVLFGYIFNLDYDKNWKLKMDHARDFESRRRSFVSIISEEPIHEEE